MAASREEAKGRSEGTNSTPPAATATNFGWQGLPVGQTPGSSPGVGSQSVAPSSAGGQQPFTGSLTPAQDLAQMLLSAAPMSCADAHSACLRAGRLRSVCLDAVMN